MIPLYYIITSLWFSMCSFKILLSLEIVLISDANLSLSSFKPEKSVFI